MPIKRIALASLAVIMALWSVPNPARASYSRVTKTFTVTAGTPVQVVSQQPTVADEVIIQPVAGATVGLVYVMAGVYNHTPLGIERNGRHGSAMRRHVDRSRMHLYGRNSRAAVDRH